MSKQEHGRTLAHIIDSSIPGGGPRVLLMAARGLMKYGWSSVAICGNDGPLAADLRTIGTSAQALPIAGKWRFTLAFPLLVWRLLCLRPAAVVLYGPIAGCIGGLAARLVGIRTILYFAGYPSFYADVGIVRRVRNALVEWIACACASAIWCHSTGDREWYAARGLARSKLHMVPVAVAQDLLERLAALGVDDETVGGDALHAPDVEKLRASFGLDASHLIVGFVGRLVQEKGVEVLLQAFAQVVQARPETRLIIVGEGPERARLTRRAAELKIDASVVFTGLQRDVALYYLLADVIALPSLYEPGGTTAVEAMASTRAVVATRVHGYTDSVLDSVTGRLVPPGDPTALAAALLWALESPQRLNELGAQGRKRVIGSFTEPQMAARVNRLLHSARTPPFAGGAHHIGDVS